MKRYIVNILLFFAIVAVIDLCVGYAGDWLQCHAKSGDTRKTNNLALIDQHDVLVFGSSRACHHYDTPFLSEVLGFDVYNAGYDGNGVIFSYGLLSMILERYQPKLIIFDVEPAFDINVYSEDNNHKRYIRMLKPYYKLSGVKEVIKDVSLEEWYKCFSGMMRYNTTIISKSLDNVKRVPNDNHGYKPLYGTYKGKLSKKKVVTTIIDKLKLKYFEKMLLLVQSSNIPIIVVASPKLGGDSSEELLPVKELCKKHNVSFWDYYSEEDFIQHKELFNEPMHLNEKGARQFTDRISKEINDTLLFQI